MVGQERCIKETGNVMNAGKRLQNYHLNQSRGCRFIVRNVIRKEELSEAITEEASKEECIKDLGNVLIAVKKLLNFHLNPEMTKMFIVQNATEKN